MKKLTLGFLLDHFQGDTEEYQTKQPVQKTQGKEQKMNLAIFHNATLENKLLNGPSCSTAYFLKFPTTLVDHL